MQSDVLRAVILSRKGYDAAVRRSRWRAPARLPARSTGSCLQAACLRRGGPDGKNYSAMRRLLAAREREARQPTSAKPQPGSSSAKSQQADKPQAAAAASAAAGSPAGTSKEAGKPKAGGHPAGRLLDDQYSELLRWAPPPARSN